MTRWGCYKHLRRLSLARHFHNRNASGRGRSFHKSCPPSLEPTRRVDATSSSSSSTASSTFIGAIDQGTSSTRFIIFDENLETVASHQVPVKQSFPHPGWADMDANEIFTSVNTCAETALEKAGLQASDLLAVGVTNQRETTVVWDRHTGHPLAPAMLWFDDRTKPLCNTIVEEIDFIARSLKSMIMAGATELGGDPQIFQKETGLRINPYFSAFKLRWLIENDSKVKEAVDNDSAAFGTVESYLIWKLTEGRKHVTDCTNASRTMLMDLKSLEWSEKLCDTLGVPYNGNLLPQKIVSNAEKEAFGYVENILEVFDRNICCASIMLIVIMTEQDADEDSYVPSWSNDLHGHSVVEGPLKGVPICGAIGDQQGALVGQRCFEKGQLKNTFGTGQFLLLNTGTECVYSEEGLLSTVAYQIGQSADATYAVEGAVAISGVGLKWMVESMGFASSPKEIVDLAQTVESTKGLYFVPAFSGLMAPHWKPDARGIMIGWTHYHGRAHLCRALVEALCFQCRDVVQAMGVGPELIKVDGGVAQNDFVMQLLADITQVPVVRPKNVETTGAGAAIMAGLGAGLWKDIKDVDNCHSQGAAAMRFDPDLEAEAEWRHGRWNEALQRCIGIKFGEYHIAKQSMRNTQALTVHIGGKIITLAGIMRSEEHSSRTIVSYLKDHMCPPNNGRDRCSRSTVMVPIN
eukprot:jgi/Bigna1/91890/estExt_fgenesh1_pg.C_1280005